MSENRAVLIISELRRCTGRKNILLIFNPLMLTAKIFFPAVGFHGNGGHPELYGTHQGTLVPMQ